MPVQTAQGHMESCNPFTPPTAYSLSSQLMCFLLCTSTTLFSHCWSHSHWMLNNNNKVSPLRLSLLNSALIAHQLLLNFIGPRCGHIVFGDWNDLPSQSWRLPTVPCSYCPLSASSLNLIPVMLSEHWDVPTGTFFTQLSGQGQVKMENKRKKESTLWLCSVSRG